MLKRVTQMTRNQSENTFAVDIRQMREVAKFVKQAAGRKLKRYTPTVQVKADRDNAHNAVKLTFTAIDYPHRGKTKGYESEIQPFCRNVSVSAAVNATFTAGNKFARHSILLDVEEFVKFVDSCKPVRGQTHLSFITFTKNGGMRITCSELAAEKTFTPHHENESDNRYAPNTPKCSFNETSTRLQVERVRNTFQIIENTFGDPSLRYGYLTRATLERVRDGNGELSDNLIMFATDGYRIHAVESKPGDFFPVHSDWNGRLSITQTWIHQTTSALKVIKGKRWDKAFTDLSITETTTHLNDDATDTLASLKVSFVTPQGVEVCVIQDEEPSGDPVMENLPTIFPSEDLIEHEATFDGDAFTQLLQDNETAQAAQPKTRSKDVCAHISINVETQRFQLASRNFFTNADEPSNAYEGSVPAADVKGWPSPAEIRFNTEFLNSVANVSRILGEPIRIRCVDAAGDYPVSASTTKPALFECGSDTRMLVMPIRGV